jgi:DNA primase
MWLDQLGFKSVAILGAIMSRKQQELLLTLPVKEIILCLDNDKAGTIGRDKALDMLRGKITLSYIKIPSEYKDVQDIRSYDILKNVINNRRYW